MVVDLVKNVVFNFIKSLILLIKLNTFVDDFKSRRGEIGRHAGFRFPYHNVVRVRVSPPVIFVH